MSYFVKFNFNVYNLLCVIAIPAIIDLTKLSAEANPDIMTDYYWGSNELRTSSMTCDTEMLHLLCYNECGKNYICDDDRCKCRNRGETVKMFIKYMDKVYPFDDNKYTYSKENDMSYALRTAIKEDMSKGTQPEEIIFERPALRHHIAHFCPNLKEARQCIRSCMKLGKPAFCGKDHVCYCGHRYTSHDQNIKVKKNDMYAEFRDLYQKYFGPQIMDYAESADEDQIQTGTDAVVRIASVDDGTEIDELKP